MKSYIECLEEISNDELLEGLLGYGMFSEKLPPVFSSVSFYHYWISKLNKYNDEGRKKYIFFESMRYNNIPRQFGIPNPFEYGVLCEKLYDKWDDILDVFRKNTLGDKHKISRIHIRKLTDNKALIKINYGDYEDDNVDENDLDDTEGGCNDDENVPNSIERDSVDKALFRMNCKNWKLDGDPITSFFIGKKYVVKADISQCFPSIYTHAISWALVGKSTAKKHRGIKEWYNQIDKACQNMRDGETHGLLIGPHTSNLISELILTTVDNQLKSKYKYIRKVDDYTCYVEKYEDAESFLRDLEFELRKFDLLLNHKKTSIEKLPKCSEEYWTRALKDKSALWNDKEIGYNMARSYLDTVIQLMADNGQNASTIFYAIKILGGRELNKGARKYCVKMMCHLAIIYPYLIPIMDEYVFDKFNASVYDIEKFSKVLYKEALAKKNSEALNYAIFYAVKYNFTLSVNAKLIIDSYNCISKLLSLIYFRMNGDSESVDKLAKEAERLAECDFDENWLFIYEAVDVSKLKDEWQSLKNAGVSFLLPEYCC